MSVLSSLLSPYAIAGIIVVAAAGLIMWRVAFRRSRLASPAPEVKERPSGEELAMRQAEAPPDAEPIVLNVSLKHFEGLPFSKVASLKVGDVRLSKKGSVLIELVQGLHSESAPVSPSHAPPSVGARRFGCTRCPEVFDSPEEAVQHEMKNMYHVAQPLPSAGLSS